MPLFAFIGRDGPDGAALRKIHRPAHLEGIDRLHADGRILHAGPLLDEAGAPAGSVILFDAADLTEARSIASADAYVTEGVFGEWQVQETRVVRGRT